MQARTDAELVAAYASWGDETAFGEIVSRHGAMVYRVCLGLLGDPHDAEDCSQATFVVLARKGRSLSRSERLESWLYGVARHISLRAARNRGVRARREEAASMIRRTAADQSAASTDAGLRDLVYRELGSLTGAQRQAVILRYLEGRSEREAAEIAGCPQGTLACRASRGLARLRARLAKRGRALAVAPLVGVLETEAQAAVPAALLPSLAAASKLAATGAAAGAGAGGVLAMAEGAMKMMFWAKIKIAAAVLGAAGLAGAGLPLALSAVGAAESKRPAGAATAAPAPGFRAVDAGPRLPLRVMERSQVSFFKLKTELPLVAIGSYIGNIRRMKARAGSPANSAYSHAPGVAAGHPLLDEYVAGKLRLGAPESTGRNILMIAGPVLNSGEYMVPASLCCRGSEVRLVLESWRDDGGRARNIPSRQLYAVPVPPGSLQAGNYELKVVWREMFCRTRNNPAAHLRFEWEGMRSATVPFTVAALKPGRGSRPAGKPAVVLEKGLKRAKPPVWAAKYRWASPYHYTRVFLGVADPGGKVPLPGVRAGTFDMDAWWKSRTGAVNLPRLETPGKGDAPYAVVLGPTLNSGEWAAVREVVSSGNRITVRVEVWTDSGPRTRNFRHNPILVVPLGTARFPSRGKYRVEIEWTALRAPKRGGIYAPDPAGSAALRAKSVRSAVLEITDGPSKVGKPHPAKTIPPIIKRRPSGPARRPEAPEVF